VVDKDGRLINALSVADVGMCEGDFAKLQSNVRAFVLWQKSVIKCEADTTVQELCSRMVANKVRRLFMVNNEQQRQVTGVVTASDVCGVIFRQLQDESKDEKKSKKEKQPVVQNGKKKNT
jgi:predicted transcriptional regulator